MDRPAIVLLVDDDALVVRALLRSLASDAYDVISAYTVANARLILRTICPHVKVVLITDIYLKDGNGLELEKEARALRPQIRTLFTTGGDVPPGEELRTFLKPFNNLQLRRRILTELASIA